MLVESEDIVPSIGLALLVQVRKVVVSENKYLCMVVQSTPSTSPLPSPTTSEN